MAGLSLSSLPPDEAVPNGRIGPATSLTKTIMTSCESENRVVTVDWMKSLDEHTRAESGKSI